MNASAPIVLKKYPSIFVMLTSCFALWGLLNNMTDNLVPAFQKIFTMDQSRAGWSVSPSTAHMPCWRSSRPSFQRS